MSSRMLVAVVAVGFAALFWSWWLLPSGEGEYRDSADGQWRAQVSTLSRGTVLGSRRHYLEVSVERLPDHFMVWRKEIPHAPTDTVPAYGDRGARFISWATNSSQFTVTTTNGAMLVVPLADLSH